MKALGKKTGKGLAGKAAEAAITGELEIEIDREDVIDTVGEAWTSSEAKKAAKKGKGNVDHGSEIGK